MAKSSNLAHLDLPVPPENLNVIILFVMIHFSAGPDLCQTLYLCVPDDITNLLQM